MTKRILRYMMMARYYKHEGEPLISLFYLAKAKRLHKLSRII